MSLKDKFLHDLAQFLSYMLHPGLLPTVGAGYVLWVHPQPFEWPFMAHMVLAVFIGTYLGPLFAILVLRASGIISSVHLIAKEDRIYPYIAGAASMLMTGNYLAKNFAPVEISLSVYAGAFVILASAILLPFWKSSAHMAGLSGLLALFVGMNLRYGRGTLIELCVLVALLGAMAWARIYLNRHTYRELFSGAVIGFTTLYILLSK